MYININNLYPKPLTVSGYVSDFFGKNVKYNSTDAARFSVDDFAAAFVRLEGDIILDFRIAWAMHVNTPGDTIIFGTEGALRISSTDFWNGSVGGMVQSFLVLFKFKLKYIVSLPQKDKKITCNPK